MGDIFWVWKRRGCHRDEMTRKNLSGTVIITIDRGIRVGV
jgi:hypothetical protein